MARELIKEAFKEAGVQSLGEDYAQRFAAIDGPNQVVGTNVIGHVEGRLHPERYIVLSAHYDHLGVQAGQIYNGADDNASGVAALVALSYLIAAEPLKHGVVFAAFDAEEVGRQGSRSFVANSPIPLGRIVLNINMDMIGRSDGVLYAAGSYHWPLLKVWLASVSEPGVMLRLGHDRPDDEDDWTKASDHYSFHIEGIPFIYFGVEDHRDYHRPTDDFELIDRGAYLASVELIYTALQVADSRLDARLRQHLASLPPPRRSPNPPPDLRLTTSVVEAKLAPRRATHP